MTGCGDVAYNLRRSFLAAVSVEGEIAYHLFHVDTHSPAVTEKTVRLARRSKWQTEYSSAAGSE